MKDNPRQPLSYAQRQPLLRQSTSFLRCLILVGLAGSLFSLLFPSSLGLLLSWAVFLSLATVQPDFLCFPWDCLLLEMGALAVFLPTGPSIFQLINQGSMEGSPVPHPAVIFAFRFLLFRLMLGMGKKKFAPNWENDLLYIKWFCVWQPLPTPLALVVYSLPNFVFVGALAFMYVVEMLCPFAILFGTSSFYLCELAAVGTVLLQVGIGLLGNYGLFNFLTLVLSLPFCVQSHWQQQPGSSDSFLLWLLLGYYCLLGALAFPYCSYTSLVWAFRPDSCREHFVVTLPGLTSGVALRLIGLFRAAICFRVVHSYGVFGTAQVSPRMHGSRTVLQIEASSSDSCEYETVKFRSLACSEDFAGAWVAPYHPRLEHNAYYEGCNQQPSQCNFLHPYRNRANWFRRVLFLLLQGDPEVTSLFSRVPRHMDSIRVRLFHYRLNAGHKGDKWVADAGTLHTESIQSEENLDDSTVFSLPAPNSFGIFWGYVQRGSK